MCFVLEFGSLRKQSPGLWVSNHLTWKHDTVSLVSLYTCVLTENAVGDDVNHLNSVKA